MQNDLIDLYDNHSGKNTSDLNTFQVAVIFAVKE